MTQNDTKSNNSLDMLSAENGSEHLVSMSVYWSEKDPERIRFFIGDGRLTDADGARPGLQQVFSANPKSADYSPANFNRFARLLRSKGKAAPDQDVAEHPRHIRYRDALIEAHGLKSDKAPLPSAVSDTPAVLQVPDEAAVCPTCFAYVADLDQHEDAAH